MYRRLLNILNRPVSPWLVAAFILFLPYVSMWVYSDFIRESELNARLGWWVLLGGLGYVAYRCKVVGWIWKSIAIVLLLSGWLDVLYATTFGGVLTSSALNALVETDVHESLEFMQAYTSWRNVLWSVFYLGMGFWLIRNLSFFAITSLRHKMAVGLSILLIFVMIQQITQRGRTFDVLPGFIGVAIDFVRSHEGLQKQIEARQQLLKEAKFSAEPLVESPETLIFVIGEANARKHSSPYGYSRETMPKLSALSNAIFFQDTASAYAQTSDSLKVVLTQAQAPHKEAAEHALSIAGVLKKAGFEVWWISNQQPLRIPTTPIASICDQARFASDAYHGVSVRRYDEVLLPYVDEALKSPAKHKAIFVHLMGEHLQYDNRYPPKFDYFKGTKGIQAYLPVEQLSQRQIHYINGYDNAVRYTDYVVSQIVEKLKNVNGSNALTYFPDHGEEVFDEKDFKGHQPDGITKQMVEIPFVFWHNSEYKQTMPDVVKVMAKHKSVPFMTDDFFDTALCLSGVQSSLYQPSRALCDARYQPKERIIYGKRYPQEVK